MVDLAQLLHGLDTDSKTRGDQFERIVQWFLCSDPVYKRRLRRVWLWNEWPGRWGADAGIDLVAEDREGQLWAIQTKAYDPAYSVTKADVDTFLSESARSIFAFRLLIATTDRVGQTARQTMEAQQTPAGLLLLTDLTASQLDWPESPADLRPPSQRAKRPRPHQAEAIEAVVAGFAYSDRGQLIMACGTGKTLAALFISERLGAMRTLVLLPSLSLLAQTLREWNANASEDFAFLAVCSDDTVADPDAPIGSASDLGYPVTTAPGGIAEFLQRGGRQVVFATYQSSARIAEAFRLGNVPEFDLAIADEAHRCAGRVSNDFGTILNQEAVPARRRLFMTATPRYFTGRIVKAARDADFELASMDDAERFGPVLHRLSFAEAIERDLLCDYQIAVIGVDDVTYREWAERGRFVTMEGTTITDARTLAAQIGLAKAIRQYELRRTISFHSRVASARAFASSLPDVIAWMPPEQGPVGTVWATHVSGDMSTGERSLRLERLRHIEGETSGVLTNARCLSEGLDVPTLDGVAFVDPRRSEVDIVQAVGRAIRKAANKKIGTIIIPVFIGTGDDAEKVLDDSTFKPVWDVVKALRAHDTELAEQLDALRRQLGRGERQIELPRKIHFDLPDRISIDFAAAFAVRLVEQSTAAWWFWFGLLSQFAAREGHPNPLAIHEEQGFRLGVWVSAQRSYYGRCELEQERVRRLEALPGWTWDRFADRWEEGFSHLLAFVERGGNSSVPSGYVKDGYALGKWVAVQRSQFTKQIIAADRVARLEDLADWTWNPFDERWQQGFSELLRYIEHAGNARVPARHVEAGFPLGVWVANQRHARDKRWLAVDRAQRLEQLEGWTWDSFADRWENAFSGLLVFVEREGHALVPKAHKEGLLRLGLWVSNQRANYRRGTLTPERTARLESLPSWTWIVGSDEWEVGYRRLAAYAEREGACPAVAYVDDDGFRIGKWASRQRAFYAAGELNKDRAGRLEALPGWTWER